MELNKKKRLRFNNEDDLALLREVLGQNPFEDPSRWTAIQINIVNLTGKTFSIRTLRDHLELLLKMWYSMDRILKDKSGIEEIYSEKNSLLQEIYDLNKEYKEKQDKKSKLKKDTENGKQARDFWSKGFRNENVPENEFEDDVALPQALPSITSDHVYCVGSASTSTSLDNHIVIEELIVDYPEVIVHNENTKEITAQTLKVGNELENKENNFRVTSKDSPRDTPRKILRPKRSRERRLGIQKQGLSYLQDFDQQQFELKRKDQALEERRLNLEEKKFELEELKKKKELDILERKIDLEIKDRHELYKLIEKQDKLINFLLKNNENE